MSFENGSSPVDAIFNALRSASVPFIPTIGLDRVEDYADSVKVRHRNGQAWMLFKARRVRLGEFVGIRGTN